MRTTVAFNKTGLSLELPEGPDYKILHAHAAEPLPDLQSALAAALDHPIGCAPLLEMARGKRTAAISVCDITRPAPNSTTLPPILKRLHQAGMRAEDITICIATGLHRIATPDELNTILGPDIGARYPIFNHDAKNADAHAYLGDTARGTPIQIAKPFLSAELHITLGFIEPHLMLGFSGGRKLIAPGLAGEETIKMIHSPRFMRDALATEGSIEDNPLHAELLEIARTARHDFMLDVTLCADRQIAGIFAGDPVQAHATGVQSLRDSAITHIPEFVDAAITTAAGFPLDLTFYQTIKGVTATQHIVRPGGPILVIGACTEGVGSHEFAEKLASYRGAQAYLDSIADTPVVPDQWQLEKLAMVALHRPVLFYTPGVAAAAMGIFAQSSYATPTEAIAALMNYLSPKPTIAIFPEGPYAYARVGSNAVHTTEQ